MLIFYLSSCSPLQTPGPNFAHKDKVGHFVLYCIFGLLTAHGLRRGYGMPLSKTIVLAVLLSSAYGALDELSQLRVPYRTSDVMDWMADTLGATAAAAIYYTYDSARNTKKSR